MFIKIGREILNTRYIVRARYANGVCTILLRDGAAIDLNQFYDGAEAEALWEHLTSPALCTDVLADVPPPVRP